MIKRKVLKLVAGFKNLPPITQGLIILGVVLIIGIIIRWDYILTEVKRGFDFLNK